MESTNTNIPFMARLNLLDLENLMSDPIAHDETWLTIPDKIPLDIPKFNWKQGDDPANHVMSFYLWWSSNNIGDDFVRLHLLQWILIDSIAKWYLNLPGDSHATFGMITTTFITYF